MAKSLRASSKLAARNRKRYTETSDYAVTAAARLQQVSERLKQRMNQPKLSELEADKSDDAEDEAMETKSTPEAGTMQVDGAEGEAPRKISTSAPRGSRKEQWRKSRGLSMHRKSSSKSGRAKRRR
ncbi:unnamed protein product [Malassezia sympodialis ATCC 42132]|uniref:Uncharacterized protein n=1 Tax=Malassezia sympodialis (strain ATCC 42132) TaxID=1230383 RepID=M5EAB6_MALS4|nr:uncharacterized protein MSY001_1852 [Malassezia sympodialis ATCC 42132]CCU99146.1 unnamed protein product [Malassezia sympodialis ATCC 42132]SHO78390.1 Similar to S.cerevisiae protein YBL028C (Protein of unknown function that may interact with ribosomes) [Malassezia sympodialis ATCC 42132]|eukprot:XP_018740411.1 uncharacterized protein MSY001_1852 [Malassezia sympodialis ATCC 42132]